MLVLTRKVGEKVVIGHGTVRIVVTEIRSDKVRLGIDAPRDIPVHRQEVADKIKADGELELSRR